MKRLTLSADLARELGRFLEIPAHRPGRQDTGFSRKELRLIDAIQARIDGLVANYQGQATEIAETFKAERLDTLTLSETARSLTLGRINEDEQAALKELTDGSGSETVELVLEEEEFSFARQHVDAIDQFNGVKEVRRIVFGLDDALAAAVAVRVVDGRIEPVDVEDELAKVRDFSRKRAAERRRR